MFSWLKKHFIPHAGNEHRPHILRAEGARRVMVFIIAVEIIAFLLPSLANLNLSAGMAAVISSVLGELTNEERQEQNLPTLSISPLLTLAAEMKAQDMAAKEYFAHTSPEGKTPWYWIELAGYRYQYAGENLAVNFQDSEDVTEAWLQSPTHKANIVKGNYTEMGTGIARGMYQGRETVYVAQVYANPLSAPAMPRLAPGAKAAGTETAPALATQVLGTEITAEKADTGDAAKPSPAEQELKFEAKVIERPSFWQKLLASPRNTTNMIMSAIFSVIALALILYTIIKRKGHERDLLGNGLATLALVGAILVANYYASYRNMVITESYDYSLEDTI